MKVYKTAYKHFCSTVDNPCMYIDLVTYKYFMCDFCAKLDNSSVRIFKCNRHIFLIIKKAIYGCSNV